MPSLASLGDGNAVANFYSDRFIFMVEGSADKNAYERIVGPGFDADLVFQVAPTERGAGGCQAVLDRVAEERVNNKKVFGLLDGEAAAVLDGVQQLYECDDVLFRLADRDDIFFLNVHEIENLFFAHTDVCGAIASHKPMAKLGMITAANVASSLDANIDRFLGGAYCKYASAYFYAREEMRSIVSTKIFAGDSVRETIKILKAMVAVGGKLTWVEFKAKARELQAAGAQLIAARSYDPNQSKMWKLRIADGKELLHRLRKLNGEVGDAVEGHLLKELCGSGYPGAFRNQLFLLANFQPTAQL